MVQNHIRGILAMTKEQETQQEQAIAEIRKRDHAFHSPHEFQAEDNYDYAGQDRSTLIELHDSQSQTIREQAKEIERLKDLVRETSGVESDPYSVVVGGPGAPGYDGGAP